MKVQTLNSIKNKVSNSNVLVCGGNIDVQTEGKINSPNFPNQFPKNMQCIWILTTSKLKNVILEFNLYEVITIQNESGSYC